MKTRFSQNCGIPSDVINRREVFIAEDHEVRKHARKVIALVPSRATAKSLRRDAIDQRDFHPVVKRPQDATVLQGMGAEEVLRIEVKRCLRTLEDQIALNLDAQGRR